MRGPRSLPRAISCASGDKRLTFPHPGRRRDAGVKKSVEELPVAKMSVENSIPAADEMDVHVGEPGSTVFPAASMTWASWEGTMPADGPAAMIFRRG